jgi:uncharacterized protein YbjQ (UPF0145 family)
MPSTVPVWVLLAAASWRPCSSGTPSNPVCGALPAAAVVLVVPVPAAAVVLALLDPVAGEFELVVELVVEPDPHAARTSAHTTDSGSRGRISLAKVAGWRWRGVDNLSRMSEERASAGLPMTTALDIPGATVLESLGVVYGLVVRSMGFAGSIGASFKALRRGEISQYTQLLEDSRRHAIDRMVDNARLLDADAVVAVRFDSSEIGQQFTEIVAYGTAVKLDRPVV